MNKTELAAERNEKNKRLFANSPMQMDTCSPTCCQDDSSFELHVLSTNKGERNNVLNVVKQIWPWVDYIHIREKQFSLQQHFFWARHMTESGVPSSRIVINGANPFVPSEYCRGAHWSQERLKKAAVSMNAVNKGNGCAWVYQCTPYMRRVWQRITVQITCSSGMCIQAAASLI